MSITKKTTAILLAFMLIFCAAAPISMAKTKVPKAKIISATYSKSKKKTTVKVKISNANLKNGYYAYVDVTNPASIYGGYLKNKKKGTYTVSYKGKLTQHKKNPSKDMVLVYVYNKKGKYQNGSSMKIKFVK